MRITGCNNNHNGHSNRTSFKSVNRVQISKAAFEKPDDLCDVCAAFLEKFFEFISPDFAKRRFSLFRKPRISINTSMFLESPMYLGIMKQLEKVGADLWWLGKNTGLPVRMPVCNENHSFFVYTKEHNRFMQLLLSSDARQSYIEHANGVKNNGKGYGNPAFTDVCVNNFILEDFQERYPNEKTRDFVVSDLSQLPAVFRQIDF